MLREPLNRKGCLRERCLLWRLDLLFDLLVQAIAMVRDDAPEVFQAIERANPYSRQVRRRFFDLAYALDAELGTSSS